MEILLLFWRFLWRKPISYPAALPPRGEGHSSGDVWQRWDDNKNGSSIPRELHTETKHDNKLDNRSQSKQDWERTCFGAIWLMTAIKMIGSGDKLNFMRKKTNRIWDRWKVCWLLLPVFISLSHVDVDNKSQNQIISSRDLQWYHVSDQHQWWWWRWLRL